MHKQFQGLIHRLLDINEVNICSFGLFVLLLLLLLYIYLSICLSLSFEHATILFESHFINLKN